MFWCDKHNFVSTSILLSQQNTSFVSIKMTFVATLATDTTRGLVSRTWCSVNAELKVLSDENRSHRSVVHYCFTSTRTERTFKDGQPRTTTSTFTQLLNSEFDFNVDLRAQGPYGLLGTGSSGRPPRLSHSSWTLNQSHRRLPLLPWEGSQKTYLSVATSAMNSVALVYSTFVSFSFFFRIFVRHSDIMCVTHSSADFLVIC